MRASRIPYAVIMPVLINALYVSITALEVPVDACELTIVCSSQSQPDNGTLFAQQTDRRTGSAAVRMTPQPILLFTLAAQTQRRLHGV